MWLLNLKAGPLHDTSVLHGQSDLATFGILDFTSKHDFRVGLDGDGTGFLTTSNLVVNGLARLDPGDL